MLKNLLQMNILLKNRVLFNTSVSVITFLLNTSVSIITFLLNTSVSIITFLVNTSVSVIAFMLNITVLVYKFLNISLLPDEFLNTEISYRINKYMHQYYEFFSLKR